MTMTSLKRKIIQEVELIPEDKLEQLYQLIHVFRLGVERLKELTTYQPSKTSGGDHNNVETLEHSSAQPLSPDDPLLQIAGSVETTQTDLSINHDKYLYRKDWEKGS